MNEQKEKYIQSERQKIREKKTKEALEEAKIYKEKVINFERPQEGKIDKRIGGMDTFHVEKARKSTRTGSLQKGNIPLRTPSVRKTKKTQ